MAIVHKTRTQLVVEEIRERILQGDIKAGEPLRQAALAQELNVSRIPIREALVQLEAEGLVKFEPHKGATAAEISVKQVDEVFELRALLEAELLAYSIPNLTSDDIDEAGRVVDELETLDYLDPKLGELNYRFHNILYGRADRPHTFELAEVLITNSSRFIRMHMTLAGGLKTSQTEHRNLLSLCADKQVEEACAYLKAHILKAKREIISIIE